MNEQEILSRLSPLLAEYLSSLGFELVDIIYRYEANGFVLRVLADKPQGGINMDECAMLNRELGNLLDAQDIIQGKYLLEVSSPGLDRPLKGINDFRRSVGRDVRLFLNDKVEGRLELEGLIKDVTQDCVILGINGELVTVPFLKINKSKLKI